MIRDKQPIRASLNKNVVMVVRYDAQSKRIIGQLHGGSAACPALNGYDRYGLFSSNCELFLDSLKSQSIKIDG